jgi:surface antigen
MSPACSDASYNSPCRALRQESLCDVTVRARFVVRPLALALMLSASALLGGCNEKLVIGAPENPLLAGDVTGSLAGETRVFSLGLIESPSRSEAELALSRALDPVSEGQSVRWTGQSGAGTFTAKGSAFIYEDQICRGFNAVIERAANRETYQGTACRQTLDGQGGGQWRVIGKAATDL